MGVKTEKATIGGLDVRTTQLPAMRAFSLLTKVGRILAPVLSGATALLDSKGNLNLDKDVSALAPVLGEALGALEDQGAAELAAAILVQTSVVYEGKLLELGQAHHIDLVFTGRLMTMLQVLAWVLKVNYADFIGGAQAFVPASAPDQKENL